MPELHDHCVVQQRTTCCMWTPGREFTVNIISEWFLEAANHTCGPFDPDVDEMALAGLTPVRTGQRLIESAPDAAWTWELRRWSSWDLFFSWLTTWSAHPNANKSA